MKELVIGTTNPAKFGQIKDALPKNIKVSGLSKEATYPDIVEGDNLQENAKNKALTYAKFLKATVLSVDNGLFFEELPENEQPGAHVRRINHTERATDDEMKDHYKNLIKKLGGETKGWWEFAICVATPEGKTHETLIKSHRIFVSEPSEKIMDGYPLESLQKDPKTKKFISEMTKKEKEVYWQEMIGKELKEFIENLD